MKTITVKKVVHPIFESKEEFETYFMDKEGIVPELIKEWRNATEIGQWVLADDGGVVQIQNIKIYEKPKQHKGYLRTVCGTFLMSNYYKMDTSTDRRREDRYRFAPAAIPKKLPYTQSQKQQIYKKNRLLNPQELEFFFCLLRGHHPIKAYQKVYKCSTSLKYIIDRVKKLLNSERMIKMFQDNKIVKDVAEKLGINHEYILKNYQNLFNDDKSENKLKFEINTKMGDIIGTTDKDDSRDSGYLPPGKKMGILPSGGNGDRLDIEDVEAEESIAEKEE